MSSEETNIIFFAEINLPRGLSFLPVTLYIYIYIYIYKSDSMKYLFVIYLSFAPVISAANYSDIQVQMIVTETGFSAIFVYIYIYIFPATGS